MNCKPCTFHFNNFNRLNSCRKIPVVDIIPELGKCVSACNFFWETPLCFHSSYVSLKSKLTFSFKSCYYIIQGIAAQSIINKYCNMAWSNFGKKWSENIRKLPNCYWMCCTVFYSYLCDISLQDKLGWK